MKKFLSLGLAAALTLAVAMPMTATAEDLTEKLQAAVAELTAEQQAALYLLLTQVGGGDAGSAGGGSPEEQAKAAILGFVEAGSEGDYDKMLAAFSDDFEHYEYGDKEGVGEFLSQAADMGYLEGIEVVMDDAEFDVDGDTLSVYPVEFNGAFGSITFEYIFANEDGSWKIIEFDASGL